MTDRDRARAEHLLDSKLRAIISDIAQVWEYGGRSEVCFDLMRDEIASALRAAREEERERAATIAKSFADSASRALATNGANLINIGDREFDPKLVRHQAEVAFAIENEIRKKG